jgi:hypothetical protein
LLWAAGYFFMLLAGLTPLVMQPLFGALVKKLPRRRPEVHDSTRPPHVLRRRAEP